MLAEFDCIPNYMEFVSLAADVELLTNASMPSDVELIFMFCQRIQILQILHIISIKYYKIKQNFSTSFLC